MTTKPQSQKPNTAPAHLATITDLKPEEIQAVAKEVNQMIADNIALYVKYKNFHWHLSGSHFREYHLLFDEQAAEVLADVDVLAERMRRIGATTIRSISHISQLKSVQDDNDEYVSPADMLQRLMEDNNKLAIHKRATVELCEKNRDLPTANLIEEQLDACEKRKWFLFETLQGEKNTN